MDIDLFPWIRFFHSNGSEYTSTQSIQLQTLIMIEKMTDWKLMKRETRFGCFCSSDRNGAEVLHLGSVPTFGPFRRDESLHWRKSVKNVCGTKFFRRSKLDRFFESVHPLHLFTLLKSIRNARRVSFNVDSAPGRYPRSTEGRGHPQDAHLQGMGRIYRFFISS